MYRTYQTVEPFKWYKVAWCIPFKPISLVKRLTYNAKCYATLAKRSIQFNATMNKISAGKQLKDPNRFMELCKTKEHYAMEFAKLMKNASDKGPTELRTFMRQYGMTDNDRLNYFGRDEHEAQKIYKLNGTAKDQRQFKRQLRREARSGIDVQERYNFRDGELQRLGINVDKLHNKYVHRLERREARAERREIRADKRAERREKRIDARAERREIRANRREQRKLERATSDRRSVKEWVSEKFGIGDKTRPSVSTGRDNPYVDIDKGSPAKSEPVRPSVYDNPYTTVYRDGQESALKVNVNRTNRHVPDPKSGFSVNVKAQKTIKASPSSRSVGKSVSGISSKTSTSKAKPTKSKDMGR